MTYGSHGSKLALVAMPWKAHWMPSLQLAVLSTWASRTTQQRVDEYHHYLDVASAVGAETYEQLCELRGLRGDRVIALPEAFYAALLFTTERSRLTCDIERSFVGRPPFDVAKFIDTLDAEARQLVARIIEAGHAVVGMSVALYQTFSSLYLAQLIKRADPTIKVLLGGPEVAGRVGESILHCFECVDFVVTGEGELIVQAICKLLCDATTTTEIASGLAAIPGVQSRSAPRSIMPQEACSKPKEVHSLNDLPVPSFHSYFAQRPDHLVGKPIHLPVETSRGCWWDRSDEAPLKSCSFCNLNASWSRYREKDPLVAADEIRDLHARHRVFRFMLVDNVLRQGEGLRKFIQRLRSASTQLRLVLEARASLRPEEFRELSDLGVEEMQIGIESLSTRLLRRVINKGTTTLQNLQAMKWMDELGIRHVGNLIINYPGATEDELNETLQNIEFACGYQPLIAGEFSLGYYSPMERVPSAFGIRDIGNHHLFDNCLPSDMRRSFFGLERAFSCEITDAVRDLWGQITLRLAAWRAQFYRQTALHGIRSLLLFRDSREFSEIVDWRFGPPVTYLLEGEERRVYLGAMTAQRIDYLATLVPGRKLGRILQDFVDRRIMFREEGKVISLAVGERLNVVDRYASDR